MDNGKKKKGLKYIALGLIALTLLMSFQTAGEMLDGNYARMDYTEFLSKVEIGAVDNIHIKENESFMTVILFDENTKSLSEAERESYDYSESTKYRVSYPDSDDFQKEMLEKGVMIIQDENTFADAVDAYGTLILYLTIFAIMFSLMAKASPASQKGYAQVISPKNINVSFSDVIGHDEIKKDLQLLVKQLKSGENIKDLSHGVLFEGNAGTGKTMLAKAIAHEAGVNFISVNSSNFIEMYVGLGARRVRDVFKQAKALSPCVLFFDEIDAIGAKRGSKRGHMENDQTINALLTELDGFSDKGNILVIAATNLSSELDEALLRSGRFDRKIKIEAPVKWETRQELFNHYLKDKTVSEDVNTEILAKQTVGFSGADIAAICREAVMIAFSESSEEIKHSYLEEAIDKLVFKGNRSDTESHKEDLECVAYHEAGHAVMTLLSGNEISRISIMGMTSGVGGAVFSTDNDRFFKTKREYEAQIMIAYAGRASEAIKYGKENITQGASNDITKATQLLLSYSTKLGFDNELGLIDFDVLNGITIDEALTKKLSELSLKFYRQTYDTLQSNYSLVEKLAAKLLEVKTMSGNEVTEYFSDELEELKNGR